MTFSSELQIENAVARITLKGELDGLVAKEFSADIEKAAAAKVRVLALLMDGLEYMASAGIRVLVFAMQRMGPNVPIFVIGAQPSVLETMQMTGLLTSVKVLDQYDPAIVEA